MGKVENLGLNNSQGWEKEKTKGRIITKDTEIPSIEDTEKLNLRENCYVKDDFSNDKISL